MQAWTEKFWLVNYIFNCIHVPPVLVCELSLSGKFAWNYTVYVTLISLCELLYNWSGAVWLSLPAFYLRKWIFCAMVVFTFVGGSMLGRVFENSVWKLPFALRNSFDLTAKICPKGVGKWTDVIRLDSLWWEKLEAEIQHSHILLFLLLYS